MYLTTDEAIKAGVPEDIVAWNWLRQFADNVVKTNDPAGQMKAIQEAFGKQLPMKLKKVTTHYGFYEVCPRCESDSVIDEYKVAYCPWCGQKLDWSDNAKAE